MHTSNVPIVQALVDLANKEKLSLHMPGHKQGRESSLLSDWLGTILRFDQTEVGALDSLHAPDGPIGQAEQLAADLYQVPATYFTTNGASAGLMASLLTCATPGSEVIVPRNAHKAILAGLIQADLLPRFVVPEFADGYELGIAAAELQRVLQEYPRVETVVLVYPTYEGIAGNLEQLVAIAKDASCRVIVDEAHGAHFHFHPQLPESAVTTQADLVVQSPHKTLTALTGAAWIHRLNDSIDDELMRSRINLVQSTSPSWLLLGSLDLARQQLAQNGVELLGGAIAQSLQLRQAIKEETVFDIWPEPQIYQQDLLKLNLSTWQSGYTGYEVANYLQQHGFFVEMAKQQGVLLMFTIGDAGIEFAPVVQCLAALPRLETQRDCISPLPILPAQVMRPRQAYLANRTYVPASAANGRIAARPVYAYPPGAPLIYPGELIDTILLDYIADLTAAGGCLTGLQQGCWPVVAE